MNKYRNKKTTVDGIQFDSKLEADRYCFLKMMEKAGKISNLQLQVKYEIIPSFKVKDMQNKWRTIRSANYIADFEYINSLGFKITEETKGCKTKDYVLKIKMFLYMYEQIKGIPIWLHEIKHANDIGGIT